MEDKKMQHNNGLNSSFEEFQKAFPDGKARRKAPAMYDVVLLNDDFTSPDYMLSVIMRCFHLAHDDAVHMILMLQQHNEVVCGTYTREVAETKMIQVTNMSQENHQPLRCVIRKEIK